LEGPPMTFDDKELYSYDAIEIGLRAIGLKIDSILTEARK